MIPEKRRLKIANYIKLKKVVTNSEISKEFGISEITVRRDFDRLLDKGIIKKIYGGAATTESFMQEPVFVKRVKENIEEKKKIASEAIKRISDGDVVLIESGSTCLELVKLLPQKKNITIITTAPHILNALRNLKRNGDLDGEVLCCGGIWRDKPDIFIGPQAIHFFNSLRINIVFFGIVALDLEEGWMVSSIHEAEITKKIVSCSEKIIGITVSNKFNKISLSKVGSLTLFNEIITDNDLKPEILKKYKSANINITTVY
jgi:DeoR family transcriptional regulator of aga operon/DeoR family myo-inositol catabolism operon transcriptional repressor